MLSINTCPIPKRISEATNKRVPYLNNKRDIRGAHRAAWCGFQKFWLSPLSQDLFSLRGRGNWPYSTRDEVIAIALVEMFQLGWSGSSQNPLERHLLDWIGVGRLYK